MTWVNLTPYWDEIVDLAERIQQKAMETDAQGHPDWTEGGNSHLPGLCGEYTVSHLTGIPVNKSVFRGGDDGVDFWWHGIGYDAKGTPVLRNPHLLEFIGKEIKADVLILVKVDMPVKRGFVVGWATKGQMLEAPIKNLGKGPRYALRENVLIQMGQAGLPEELPRVGRDAQSRVGS